MPELTAWMNRHRWPLAVGVGLLLLLAYHAVWLVRMRDGFAVGIDEAGYLMIAFNNLDALRTDGLDGLWNAYSQQAPDAPLVPLLEIREGILPAFGVEWLAFLVVGGATYGLARTLLEPPWAALATLTVVAMPGVMNYTREFSFRPADTAGCTGLGGGCSRPVSVAPITPHGSRCPDSSLPVATAVIRPDRRTGREVADN